MYSPKVQPRAPHLPRPQRQLALLRSAGARPEVRKKSRASLSATRPSPSASASENQASTAASGTPSTGSAACGAACAAACAAAGGGARGGLPPGRMGAGPRRPASSLGSRSCEQGNGDGGSQVQAADEHPPRGTTVCRRLPPLRRYSPPAAADGCRHAPRTPSCLSRRQRGPRGPGNDPQGRQALKGQAAGACCWKIRSVESTLSIGSWGLAWPRGRPHASCPRLSRSAARSAGINLACASRSAHPKRRGALAAMVSAAEALGLQGGPLVPVVTIPDHLIN